MIILGIDPGLAIVGWGILESHKGRVRPIAFGAITTPAHTNIEDRLCIIEEDLKTIIEKYHPDEMAIEELFFTNNITTGINVAQARGVCMMAAFRKNQNLFEYTPLQVKQAVTGYGRAEKAQVQQMVKTILGLSAIPKPDDAADAIAIALCHARSSTSLLAQLHK